MGALDAQHDRHRGSARHGAQHQRPIAQSHEGTEEGGEAPHERLARVDPGEAPELEIASEQRPRHDLQRADDEGEAERDDDPPDHRLSEERGDRAREAERQGEQSDPGQQRQAAELSDLPARQVAVLHDGRTESHLVHELHEARIDHGHGEQPVVRGRDEASDDQGCGPADELGDPLDTSGPGEPRRNVRRRGVLYGLRAVEVDAFL